MEQKDYLKRVDKVWGRERWITNTELYCAKILDISCGGCSSLHYHQVKDETFHILDGNCFLLLDNRLLTLGPGATIRIKPMVPHRFYCTLDMTLGCKVLEISTHHNDTDVVRLEESKRLTEISQEVQI